ncbi:hypothetical protein EES44_30050 [Streptomyces sp. ADI96-15]|nr:hypothetical protein EES44_30050 [Streptomyces sp. ADI96-15]
MADSGCSSGTAASSSATAARSAVSQATRVASAPSSASSARSVSAPSVAGPVRLVRSRCRTPCSVTRWRVVSLPSVPRAPVTRTVPEVSIGRVSCTGGAGSVPRTRLGANAVPDRTASCGAPVPRAVARASAVSVPAPVPGSRSSSTKRSGCSVWAVRSSPQTEAATGSGASPPSPVRTAPRVTTTSRAAEKRSSASHSRRVARTEENSACTRPGTSPDGSSAPPSGTGRSTVAGTVSPMSDSDSYEVGGLPAPSRAGRSPRVSWPRMPQGVEGEGVACGGSGCQRTWNSGSSVRAPIARSSRRATGRTVSASTVATCPPAASHRVSVSASCPRAVSRARRTDAPAAWISTPLHEKGSRASGSAPVGGRSSPGTTACSTASNSAGCRMYCSACSTSGCGRRTSAKISVPQCSPSRRHTARSPWKCGPYSSPRSAISA